MRTKEFPLDDSFPYDRLIAFLKTKAPRYTHLTYYLERDRPNQPELKEEKNEEDIEEEALITRSTVP